MDLSYYRTHPFFWSRLGFCYDPPILDEQGKPVIFSRNFQKYRRIHDDFRNAGIRYHSTILHSGWVGVDTYDYSLTDETLDVLLKDNPDIFYLPRVKLNVPAKWCTAHPEDTFVYANGPTDMEEIRALTGTEKQDFFGMDLPKGYPVNGGDGSFVDHRPNVGGVIALQSFSSEQWKKDAGIALCKLMEHLRQSPYANQIIGIHVAFGCCGETTQWGTWLKSQPERRGDYGIRAIENFISFGLKKYGSEEALLKQWKASSLKEICPPVVSLREGKKNSLREFFYDDKENAICADYNEFTSQAAADAICYFCHLVKKAVPDWLAGAFYGYTFVQNSAHAGHLAIDRVLDCPDVDFIASPKGYYRCLPGDPGGEQGPADSINRKKVWMDEIDNLTHLDPRNNGRVKNFSETRTTLWREGLKNISRNQGFWWMDLGEGSFDSPEVMTELQKITAFGQRMQEKALHQSISEILLVTDDRSLQKATVSRGLNSGLSYELPIQMQLIGAPVDILRISDLEKEDLSRYKMIVFANAFYFDAGQWERIAKRLRRGAALVWHYAPGILQPDFSLENVTAVTGFHIGEFTLTAPEETFGYRLEQYHHDNVKVVQDFPAVEILNDKSISVIERYPSGEIMVAQTVWQGHPSILAAYPCLFAKDLRIFAEQAGCKLYAPVNSAVYGDNRFIAVFPSETKDFYFTE